MASAWGLLLAKLTSQSDRCAVGFAGGGLTAAMELSGNRNLVCWGLEFQCRAGR